MRRRRGRRWRSRGVSGEELGWSVNSNPVVVSVGRELVVGRDFELG